MRDSQRIYQMPEPSSIGLFKGLGKQEIAAIRVTAAKRTFETSEIIVRTEEPAIHFFRLEVGCVNYYVVTSEGRELLLRRLVPGNVFGVAALVSEPSGYLGTAQAVRESEALMWERNVVHQLGRAHPRFLENALRSALRYVAAYAKRHIGPRSDTTQERIAWALSNLGSRMGHVLPDGLEIEIKNEDLAYLAEVSYFTASQFLHQWEVNGVVKKSRGKILIRRPEELLGNRLTFETFEKVPA